MTKTVTLTSSGTDPLTISAASITGTGFGESGISGPVTLNPGQTAMLTISFDPATAGPFSGSVTIGSNATRQATISLSGTGQARGDAERCLLQQRFADGSGDRCLHGNADFGGDQRDDGEPDQQQQRGDGAGVGGDCGGRDECQLHRDGDGGESAQTGDADGDGGRGLKDLRLDAGPDNANFDSQRQPSLSERQR